MRHKLYKEKALIGLFKIRIFSVCAPQLSGRILFAPPRCTCNIWGGGGGSNGKDPKINIRNQKLKTLIFKN